MREKLIELLKGTPDVSMSGTASEMLADHLIANGVTIPVRCEECKFSRQAKWYRAKLKCQHPSTLISQVTVEVSPNHFCGYGERRTDV